MTDKNVTMPDERMMELADKEDGHSIGVGYRSLPEALNALDAKVNVTMPGAIYAGMIDDGTTYWTRQPNANLTVKFAAGMEERKYIRADRCAEIQASGRVGVDLAKAAELRADADRAYLRYIEILQKPECLGAEVKLKSGDFTLVNLGLFAAASEKLGFHRGVHHALRMIDAQPSHAPVATDKDGMDKVREAIATWADKIERLGFSIPAPNTVTPELVQLAIHMRHSVQSLALIDQQKPATPEMTDAEILEIVTQCAMKHEGADFDRAIFQNELNEHGDAYIAFARDIIKAVK